MEGRSCYCGKMNIHQLLKFEELLKLRRYAEEVLQACGAADVGKGDDEGCVMSYDSFQESVRGLDACDRGLAVRAAYQAQDRS